MNAYSPYVLGKKGEDIACNFLVTKGFCILEKNWHCRYGEIDIIAREQGIFVFVEVKMRRSDRFGTSEEAMTKRKQKKIYDSACFYLMNTNQISEDIRFDLLAIVHSVDSPIPIINHYHHVIDFSSIIVG